MYPDKAGWTLTNHLLAVIADTLRWLKWAKTKDGAKNRNEPEPIARPGIASNRKEVHPNARGLPRSKVRRILQQHDHKDRVKRLTDLFQGKS